MRSAEKTRHPMSRPALTQARRPWYRHCRALFAQKSFYLGAFRFERAVLRADFFDSSIGQDNLGCKHMVGRCSVKRCARAGRIVRDHSADGCARTSRHIRPETKAVRFQKSVQLIQYHACAHAHATFFEFELRYPAIMPREIDDQSVADCVAD